jgi:hypothetical protein
VADSEGDGLRIARVFDGRSETGPYFTTREKISDPEERAAILDYLMKGKTLAAARGKETDWVDTANGKVVPMGFRTDGRWVWESAAAYYLRAHGFAPEPDFLDYLRRRGYEFIDPTADEVTTAGAVLRERMWGK